MKNSPISVAGSHQILIKGIKNEAKTARKPTNAGEDTPGTLHAKVRHFGAHTRQGTEARDRLGNVPLVLIVQNLTSPVDVVHLFLLSDSNFTR